MGVVFIVTQQGLFYVHESDSVAEVLIGTSVQAALPWRKADHHFIS